MSLKNAKKGLDGPDVISFLSLLSIPASKLLFFTTWSILILMSIFPWQVSIFVVIFTAFVLGKEKIKALIHSILSVVLGWGFFLLYFTVKSKGNAFHLARDLSYIVFGNEFFSIIIYVAPIVIAVMLGFFGGLFGIYLRVLVDLWSSRMEVSDEIS